MIKLAEMKERIVESLYYYKAYELPEVCDKLGMITGETSEAMNSKRTYVRTRIAGFGKQEIVDLLYKMKNELDINLIPEEQYNYKVTNLTKKSIRDILLNGYTVDDFVFGRLEKRINWHGTLDPINFMKRITNVNNIPVEDTRYKSFEKELWQHTINNDDYESDWFFEFERLPYKQTTNLDFLKVIAEMFHPEVRDESSAWEDILGKINELILHDGYKLVAIEKISGRKVFGPKKITFLNNDYSHQLNEVTEVINNEYLRKNIVLIQNSIKENPSVAIGKAKELLETTLKFVLDNNEIKYKKNESLVNLDKLARTELKLNATKEKANIRGVNDILGGLAKITKGMGELRNDHGDGHGKKSTYKELPERYAKLAVGSVATYVVFLLDTYEFRKRAN